MSSIFKIISVMITILILSASVTLTGCSRSVEKAPEIGKYAPDFQLSNLDGEAVALSDLTGNPILLNIWATWCGPCVYEMPMIQEIYDTWGDKGLIVLGINSGESADQVKRFMQSNGYTFPVVLDSAQTVTGDYNIRGIPTTFFINPDGLIAAIRVGAFMNTDQIIDSLKKIMP
jgi:thiol-disulfide isomerase/thioredoxin